jgi:hypothetical protein
MREVSEDLISDQTYQLLNRLFSGLSSEQAILIDHIKNDILSNISHYSKMADFRRPVEKVEAIFLKKVAHYPKDVQIVLKSALVAKLAIHLPVLVGKMNLPASILALYPDAFGRLADYLKSASGDAYDLTSDFFRKDIRFVLGLTIPCGAFVVDMFARVRLRTVILSFLRSGNIKTIIRYLRIRGYGPWFNMHIDQRYLTDLNEQAHDRMYLRIAELLKRRKDIRGTTGSSWLYDPQLLKISTRHAYIQMRPLERGAFLLKHSKMEPKQATMTSKSRRRLYEEGKYIPREYSLLWPRNELISWAEKSYTSHD